MIKEIIKYLPQVEADTENLKIAKGRYLMPTTLKQAIKYLKQQGNG